MAEEMPAQTEVCDMSSNRSKSQARRILTQFGITWDEMEALEEMVRQGDEHGSYDFKTLDKARAAIMKLKGCPPASD